MGGEDSFREFVHARGAALARVAFLLTADRHLAEDLLQSALHKTALHWRQIDEGRREAYVRTVLYHEAVSWWRRGRSREIVSDRVGVDREDPAGLDRAELRLVLRDALARLTPRQRAVLVLRYYEDLTEAQTAVVLGVSVGTVKSQTRHALGRLRVLAPELADVMEVSR